MTSKPAPVAARAAPPRIWLVLGDKRGDNGQVEVIAEALRTELGWTSERKFIAMLPRFVVGKPRVGPTLYHIDHEQSDALTAPWPDLVLTVGRRPANVALWIKRQSGGRSRIVLVGKPSGHMSQFDLIITSAETLPAPFPNVLRVGLPLMRIDQARLQDARQHWQAPLSTLPRPLVAILIGGPTNPYVFNKRVTEALIEQAQRVVADGGTPYLVSSRRTPQKLVAQLRQGLPAGAWLYDWNEPSADNPYLGLLALADRFIVTGDSISMMVEVAALKRPLRILPLPTGLLGGLDHGRRSLAAWLFQPARDNSLAESCRLVIARAAYRLRLMQQTRHFPNFHRMLVRVGLADWAVPVPPAPERGQGTLADDLPRILQTIAAQMGHNIDDQRSA